MCRRLYLERCSLNYSKAIVFFLILLFVGSTWELAHVIRKRGTSGECVDVSRVPCLKVISATPTSEKNEAYTFDLQIYSDGQAIENQEDMHINWVTVHSNGSTNPLKNCKNKNTCETTVKIDPRDNTVIEVLVAVGFQHSSEKSIVNIDFSPREYLDGVEKRDTPALQPPVKPSPKENTEHSPKENTASQLKEVQVVVIPPTTSKPLEVNQFHMQINTKNEVPPAPPAREVNIVVTKDKKQEERLRQIVDKQEHRSNRRLSFIALMLSRLFKLLKIMKKSQHDYTERSEEIEERLAAEFTRTMNKLWGSVSENIVRDDIELHQELATTLKKVTDMFHTIQQERSRDFEKVRPKWSKWTTWSKCSATCGEGNTNRQRICVEFGRAGCNGTSHEKKKCTGKLLECPPVVQWSEWSSWRPCSKTCGSGWRVRTRTCYISKAENSCENDGSQIEKCEVMECPRAPVISAQLRQATTKRTTTTTTVPSTSPLPGHWSNWDMWSHCSAGCGLGYETRRRKCTFVADLADHFIEEAFMGRHIICDGPDNEEQKCIRNACDLENVAPIVRSVLGGEATLQCIFDEYAHPVELSWITPTGEHIKADKPHARYEMNGRNLRIHYVGPMDRGTFHCVVQIAPGKFVTADAELAVVSCEDNPCKNAGSCVEMADDTKDRTVYHFHCNCPHGYGGTFCEINQTLFWAVLGIVVVSIVLILVCIAICLFLRAKQKKIFGEYKDLYITDESTGIDSSPERIYDIESPKKNLTGDTEVKETVKEIGSIFSKIRSVQKDVHQLVQDANADTKKLDAPPPPPAQPSGETENKSQNQRTGSDETDVSTFKVTSESTQGTPVRILNYTANCNAQCATSSTETCVVSPAPRDSDATRDAKTSAVVSAVANQNMKSTPPFGSRRANQRLSSSFPDDQGQLPQGNQTQGIKKSSVIPGIQTYAENVPTNCLFTEQIEAEVDSYPETGPISKYTFKSAPRLYYQHREDHSDFDLRTKPPTGAWHSPRGRADLHSPIVKAYRKAKAPASEDEVSSADEQVTPPKPAPSARLSLFEQLENHQESSTTLKPRTFRLESLESEKASPVNVTNMSKAYASRKGVRTKLDFSGEMTGLERGDNDIVFDNVPAETQTTREIVAPAMCQKRTPQRMAKIESRSSEPTAVNENQNNRYRIGDGTDLSPISDLRSTSSSATEASASGSQNSISSLIGKFEKSAPVELRCARRKRENSAPPLKSAHGVESKNVSGKILAHAKNSKKLSAAYKTRKNQNQANSCEQTQAKHSGNSAYRALVQEMQACIKTLRLPQTEDSPSISVKATTRTVSDSIQSRPQCDGDALFDGQSTDSQSSRNSSAIARDDLMTWFDDPLDTKVDQTNKPVVPEKTQMGSQLTSKSLALSSTRRVEIPMTSASEVSLGSGSYTPNSVMSVGMSSGDKNHFREAPAPRRSKKKNSKGESTKSVTFSSELTRQIPADDYYTDRECGRGNYATLSMKANSKNGEEKTKTDVRDRSPVSQHSQSVKSKSSINMKKSFLAKRLADADKARASPVLPSVDPDLELLADIDSVLSDASSTPVITSRSAESLKDFYTLTAEPSFTPSTIAGSQPWWVTGDNATVSTGTIRGKLQNTQPHSQLEVIQQGEALSTAIVGDFNLSNFPEPEKTRELIMETISGDTSPSVQNLSLREVSDDLDPNDNTTYQVFLDSLHGTDYMNRISSVGEDDRRTQSQTVVERTASSSSSTTVVRQTGLEDFVRADEFYGVDSSGGSS